MVAVAQSAAHKSKITDMGSLFGDKARRLFGAIGLLIAGISCLGDAPMPSSAALPAATELTHTESEGSRQNPYPLGSVVELANWQASVTQMIRGDEAESLLLAANMFNDPAPDGFEYLLLKLSILKQKAESDNSLLQMGIVGDRHRLYYSFIFSAVEPQPRLPYLDDIPIGTGIAGWKAFLIGEQERGLLLYLREEGADRRFYLQLEEGASHHLPTSLDDIPSTEEGKSPTEPAPFGQALVTESWQLQIKEMAQGEEAWRLLQEANQFAKPPPAGMDYLLLKLHVRNLEESEGFLPRLTRWDFAILENGARYEPPTSPAEPFPPLGIIALYAGGDSEGWIVLQMPATAQRPILVFEPPLNAKNGSRYFSLLTTGR